jgi:predicted 3-demethylubiquinone-9 3-methyltransferase (glyoxalase superfamily)
MPKITPFLWFDKDAEKAAKFYVSIFPNSKITDITRYTELGPGPKGSVMTVAFTLDGQKVTAINGGPVYKLTPAFSMVVDCRTQKDVNHYWKRLTSGGGKPVQCGWLEDKFGVSWQIVPSGIFKLFQGKGAKRAMEAMFKMQKLDIDVLKKAYAGR